MMDDHDRKNLEFLLKSSAEELETWYNNVGEDDRVYAQELLDAYQEELDEKISRLDSDSVLDELIELAVARGCNYIELERKIVH